MNSLPPPKLSHKTINSYNEAPIHSIYRETHKYTFFGYVRKKEELLFKTFDRCEMWKVFYALGGED